MKRKIVDIDETKCDGCGLCIPNCHEGAIKLFDGKARLVSDVYCDGLGACLGTCPRDAITIIEREAKEFDQPGFAGCPGARTMNLATETKSEVEDAGKISSRLSTWPVQLHLVQVSAPHFKGRNLLLAADCVACAVGDFHRQFLKDSVLAIACPKLDDGQEIYLEKLKTLITESGIASLTVMTMEVPCCSGLVMLVRDALDQVKVTNCPVDWKIISVKGEVIKSTVLQ